MTASAFQVFALAILASPIIAELDLSRAQLGLVGSVNTAIGAVTAPMTGRLTDRIGPRRAVSFVLGFSAAGMALMAWAPSMWWLFLAAAVGGIPQGWGNPATNSLIATRVAPGRRGGVTGVKQSGVTLGVFLSGLALPAFEAQWDWRAASFAFAVVFTVLAVAVHFTLGPDPEAEPEPTTSSAGSSVRGRLDPFVVRLAVFALLMGTAGGAVGRFFPLYAEESLGFSLGTAGLLTAIGGLLGMIARVIVGRLAENRIAPTRLLSVLAMVGVSYCVLLAAVNESTRGLLFLAPPLSAVGIAAWNAVAMLAIIMFFSKAQSGRASGVVMLGFLGGMSISAPVAGFTVDRIGVYWPVWTVAACLAAIAAALMWFDTTGRTPAAAAPAGSVDRAV
ncbi:MAG: MFS transporter [Ilumatobacteraceae bacterium]|nr:MFS transporter [Ilumatobacteraceae bacterium]